MAGRGALEGNAKQRFVLQPFSIIDASFWRRRADALLAVGLAILCLPYGFFYALTTPYLIVPFAMPIVILAAMVIWALPDMRRSPARSIEMLLFAFFACLVLWPNYLAISLPGLPWITLLRLTGFPMALALLVCVSASEEFRRKMAEILNSTPFIWKAMAVFVTLQFLTLGMMSNPMAPANKLMSWQVNWTVVFFASCYVFAKPGKAQIWAALLWAMVVGICVVGALENSRRMVLWAASIPSFLKVDADSVAGILAGAYRSATGLYRIKTTFSTPLGLAEFIALSMPFVIHFGFGRYPFAVRSAAIVTIPAMIYVVILTDSRLGMVGTFMSILLYLLFWSVLRWRRERNDLFAPAIVFAYPAVFTAAIAATFLIRRLRLKVWGGGAQQASDAGRMSQIQEGLPMIIKNPIGHGPTSAAVTLGHYGGGGVLTIDNYYLAIALEYGIIGFVAYYGIVIFAGLHAGRLALTLDKTTPKEFDFFIPLAVSVFNFLIIKSVFSQQDNHSLFFMMLGMIVALTYRYNQYTRHNAVGGLGSAAPRAPRRTALTPSPR